MLKAHSPPAPAALALLICWLSLGLLGCSQLPSAEQRLVHANAIAAAQGWQPQYMRAGEFVLASYGPAVVHATERLTIYLEGDGFAWRSRAQPSLDPTPLKPMALELALAQPQGAAVYLARPCQFQPQNAPHCAQRYWTEARFAPEVLSATLQAIEQLKQAHGASQLILVGYSGGGTLAALVAAQRQDVQQLITLAAPLDHQAWTQRQQVSPLRHSLNPADYRLRLQRIPQWHVNGTHDAIVPSELTRDFIAAFQPPHQVQFLELSGANHHCCWVEQWPQLWPTLTAPANKP